MFYAKYEEECIDIILEEMDEFSRDSIYEQYMFLFSWRHRNELSKEEFISFINTHNIGTNMVFRILIENSTKPYHPLNVKLLTELLIEYSLPERDYFWTIFINNLYYENERIYQITDYCKTADFVINKHYILLLELLTWFLTSSNRMLRDNVSQAMIIIMKEDISCCISLWYIFKNVNDPYITERLMGIFLGAIIKRTRPQKTEFELFAKEIYKDVFDKHTKYKDILLLDYSRLIIERYMWEYPDECNWIIKDRIMPPYGFDDIPKVKEQVYYEDKEWNGARMIARSMRPDCGCDGMYGDFGRYKYEAIIKDFIDVDILNVYHASMQYIRDILHYKNDFFSDYDKSLNYTYDRHASHKIERIGKKYQWITMHHMLALVADNHLVKGDSYSDNHIYKGAWELNVRDFDPTFIEKRIGQIKVPFINYPHTKLTDDILLNHEILPWLSEKPQIFDPTDLMVNDGEYTWMYLYKHTSLENLKHELYSGMFSKQNGAKRVWKLDLGCFVPEDAFTGLLEEIAESNFYGRWFPEYNTEYTIYSGEPFWSPACEYLIKNQWKPYCKLIDNRNISHPDAISVDIERDNNGEFNFIYEESWYGPDKSSIKEIIPIMPAAINIVLEKEYNAAQKDAYSIFIPCLDIINTLNLEQTENAITYFHNNELVAFDGSFNGTSDGLVIRQDYLEKYMKCRNLILVWTCMGEKNYLPTRVIEIIRNGVNGVLLCIMRKIRYKVPII